MSKSNTVSPIEPDFKHTPKLSVINGSKGKDILEQREFGKTIRQHVYEFTVTFCAFFIVVADGQLWKGRDFLHSPVYWLAACLPLIAVYKLSPRSLIPVWKGWLKFGGMLGLVTSSIVLAVMWFCLFFPISLLMKMTGKQAITMKFKDGSQSYWEERDTTRDDMKLMERQF